jgi:hypothetical protein
MLNTLSGLSTLSTFGGDGGGGAAGYSWTNSEGSDFEAQADGTGWDDTLRGDIDQLISDLKSGQINGSNVYSGFDRILLMDLPNEADSLRYLNAPTLTATNVSATSHTANQGFTGDGTADYIDTGWDPSNDGSQYTQNSASLGVWVRTAQTLSSRSYTGSGSQADIIYGTTTGNPFRVAGPNGGGAVVASTAISSATGLLGVNRSGASATQNYLNGTQETTGGGPSASPDGLDIRILDGGGKSDGQVSIWFVGRSSTADEWADIHDAFDRYRTAREAA